jgi:hypothetical protein
LNLRECVMRGVRLAGKVMSDDAVPDDEADFVMNYNTVIW